MKKIWKAEINRQINSNHGKFLYLTFCSLFILTAFASLAWSATISGKVEIDGKTNLSGVLIIVQKLDSTRLDIAGITKSDGTYTIPDVPPGSYQLIAQRPGCLAEILEVTVSGESTSRKDFKLKSGDLNIDNQINLLDRIVLSNFMGAKSGDVNWDSMIDIVEDGIIDDKDKDLLLSNWKQGKQNLIFGTLEVNSIPSGAAILINGAETGYNTPHFFRGLVTGKYNITLIRENYPTRTEIVQVKKDELASLNPVLDNQPPEFAEWTLDPPNLTEDSKGRLRVSVRVFDKGGSGLAGKIPQFDYHIGANTNYTGYKDMNRGTGDFWYFDIPEPLETWDVHRGKYIYFKASVVDVAGNKGESAEQTELIDDINDPPVVKITSKFNVWEKGLIKIDADASDTDGKISRVKFEYSIDNIAWIQIGPMDDAPPYSVAWETATVIRDIVKNVWIRVTAYDDKDATAVDSTKTTFGIDNQPPITTNDYDRLWHNKDFVINLKSSDGEGVGVSKIFYTLNKGIKQESQEGQTSLSVNITREGSDNILEYWSLDKLGNEEQQKTLSNIKLDKTAPKFAEWKQDPPDITEDSKGRLRVSLIVTDEGGSGLEGKIPQIDYRIGRNARYDGYENMITEDGKTWQFNIFEPLETWDAYRGDFIFYKVRVEDVAGNVAESLERSELIDDINDPPSVTITSRFNPWMKGKFAIEAVSSDVDGKISGVQFEYSFDKNSWTPIGPIDIIPPYAVEWDTSAVLPKAEKVWIRATATDDGNAKTSYIYPVIVGIDNQPPTTKHDYDGLWRTMDFAIVLTASDENGIGVSISNIKYKINNGEEKNLSKDGQPWITKEGINELEYWSVDDLGNEETHRKLTNIRLDKTPPEFSDWTKDPKNLTEDSTGPFRVSVRVTDSGGSGLFNKVPQLSYRIGKDKPFSEYRNMVKGEASDVWYYDIPQPQETWDGHRGKILYYKASIMDVAGNLGISSEQEELIDSINDPPVVTITSKYSQWEKGTISIDAESYDTDGTVTGVRFEYSFNQVLWTPISALIAIPPYSVKWDTKVPIPEVATTVWIKAVATDNDGATVEYKIPTSFRVDNQPPVITHDYDKLWRNKDFVINLRAGDRNGIGVDKISYKLNYGETKSVTVADQVSVAVTINTEGAENVLEYWSTDKLGNESVHEMILDIKLDKTPPTFSEWKQDPADLTEDTKGRFRVFVQVGDKGGSGILNKIPQIDYRIGTEKPYDGYENMITDDGKTWRFDIPEPSDTWNNYRGNILYYKTRIEDIAGNVAESPEQRELIDSINDIPIVKLTTKFRDWEGGNLIIKAEASDPDGSTPSVQFYSSFNMKDWVLITITTTTPPEYSIIWNTKTSIPVLEKTVWVKAVATDADDKNVMVEDITPKSFGVDNEVPTFGEWTKTPQNLTEDTKGPVRVQVSVDDGQGSGVAKAELAYRIGTLIQRSFSDMTKGTGNFWYFDIPEPLSTWDRYRGENLYFRARAIDMVGNQTPETPEQEELIDSINDPPRGLIYYTYKTWEKGTISMRAEATDDDGQVESVQFKYSLDNINWVNIGQPLTKSPYVTTWDTTVIDADPDIWLKAVFTDNEKATSEAVTERSFGVDNKAPVFSNWTQTNLTEDTEDVFRVELVINDMGSGVDTTKVEFKHHIGANTPYNEYRGMFRKAGSTNIWFYEIPRPAGGWGTYAGQTIYYMVRAADIAGNSAESEERTEFIEPTTGSISGFITPRESWLKNAKVAALQNNVILRQVSVSLSDGSYSLTKLKPGFYDLEVTASGYGTDRSIKNIEVKAGQNSPNNNVEIFKYIVANITQAQGGIAEYVDENLANYRLVIENGTMEGKVVLGMSGIEPTSVPNPNVTLLRSVGVGFQGRTINKPMKLVITRPAGITDAKSIMTFIYNGIDYRFVDRDNITQTDTTITITLGPEDVLDFSDRNHNFTKDLSRTSDTVFYALVTRFNDPQVSTISIGMRNTLSPQNVINISLADQKVAVIIHGITSSPEDFTNMIVALRALNYYDHILYFNYVAGNPVSSNSTLLLNGLASILPSGFAGKVDIIAHDMGGLIARRAIVNGGDSRIGSLVMLGVPNGGVDSGLLKLGFAEFLKKTSGDAAWTYYKDGWQDILTGSSFLSTLNSQLSRPVNTHYYGIGVLGNNDGLVSSLSANFTDSIRFPNMERPITKKFESVAVLSPTTEGPGFMSRTTHVAMVKSTDVINKVTQYELGKSKDIKFDKYEGNIVPGQTVSEFKVILKNTGTEVVQNVIGKLSTPNAYVRKYNDLQGIENDTADFGDLIPNSTKAGQFSFKIAPEATVAIGQPITFTLNIRNSSDNSVAKITFDVTIGGNLVLIALDSSNNKQVAIDVRKDTTRPKNDGDPAIEPGEIMKLDITLRNNSSGSLQLVTGVLKSNDTRITGLTGTTQTQVDMVNTGITVDYGTLAGNSTKSMTFQFIKINDNFTPLGSKVNFTLTIMSGSIPVGNDEFSISVGANIVMTSYQVDKLLVPGQTTPQDIDVDIKNITSSDIRNVRVELDSPDANINNYRQDLSIITAGDTETITYQATIPDPDFSGYAVFTLKIRVSNVTINEESFSVYFGKRTVALGNWLVGDDDGDRLPEPGETVRFQIERWNFTQGLAERVESTLSTTDPAVIVNTSRNFGDYRDIPAGETRTARRDYEFTVGKAGSITVTAPESNNSVVTNTTLQLPGAIWIPGAFIGGTLNPNTDQQLAYIIVNNTTDTITVQAGSTMTDVAGNGGKPFRITPPTAAPYNQFIREGYPVTFKLDIKENGETMPQETFKMRMGGIVRYLPPTGLTNLLLTISDSKGISANNNANGKPEPGETIELEITLKNTTSTTNPIDVTSVTAELYTAHPDVDMVQNYSVGSYGSISRGQTKSAKFRAFIRSDFEGDTILFQLTIDGRISGTTEDLGTDEFVIPVFKTN